MAQSNQTKTKKGSRNRTLRANGWGIFVPLLMLTPLLAGAKGCDDAIVGNDCPPDALDCTTGEAGAPSGTAGAGNGTAGSKPTHGGGPSVQACGGLLGLACGRNEYCQYAPEALCGAFDQTGICTALPTACDDIYSPVCGCDGRTYSNACEAAAAGTSVSQSGACDKPDPGPDPQVCGGLAGLACARDEYCAYPPDAMCGIADATGVCRPKPDACDTIYQPVCGCDGKTYGNACDAALAGVSVASEGECGRPTDPGTKHCGGLAGLACARGEYCHYSLDAMCGWADATGVCRPLPTGGCREIYQPVCGCDGKTYGNECEANSAGVSAQATGECETTEPQPTKDCGGIAGLPCAKGEFCNYPVDARCGAADQTGACEVIPSACTREYAPVCGCDGVTYSNACVAASAGVSVSATGACR